MAKIAVLARRDSFCLPGTTRASPTHVVTKRLSLAVGLVLLTACGTVRSEPETTYAGLHPAGFADPNNADFHGRLLRTNAYPLGVCQSCHGQDFLGGDTGTSCKSATCHPQGPTACTTCHGQPPQTGAHAKHVPKYPCATCHPMPTSWDSPGHIDKTGKVAVMFGGVAVTGGASPAYDSGRCSNTYCHGTSAGSGAMMTPEWTQGPSAATCGNCHGLPPPHHLGEACDVCHGAVVDAQRNIVHPERHADGIVEVRDLSAGCSSCHGPPQDLGGQHTRHITGGVLGKAVPCSECHIVPSEIGSPGHIDSTRADVTFGPLATQGGTLTPSYDGTKCSGTYCHGATLSGGASTTPVWQSPYSGLTCGGCHGVPMPNHYHERCNECHGSVVNRFLEIIDPSLHINGQVDFGFSP
jgi:predicted CxxxxCH...CXXCH cytochrome family protein